MQEPAYIDVEIAYALPEQQWLLQISVPAGTTALKAVHLSDIENQVPSLSLDPNELCIFSEKVSPDTILKAGDRVEIYRPLTIDPMESRRLRAQASTDKAFKKR